MKSTITGSLHPASARCLQITRSAAMEAGGLHWIKTSFLPALTMRKKSFNAESVHSCEASTLGHHKVKK